MSADGVKISTKEIYDMVLHCSTAVEKLEVKIEHLENIENICIQAAKDAERALKILEESKTNRSYLFQIIIGAVVTGIVTVLIFVLSGGKVQ